MYFLLPWNVLLLRLSKDRLLKALYSAPFEQMKMTIIMKGVAKT